MISEQNIAPVPPNKIEIVIPLFHLIYFRILHLLRYVLDSMFNWCHCAIFSDV